MSEAMELTVVLLSTITGAAIAMFGYWMGSRK